ncbi:hypothetical protein C6497_04715 [Candidatus Poribacteria bacterium]|nr:MAG: hypothetical protein C6497_04715 [Candidatus Poribacteria bacterium]
MINYESKSQLTNIRQFCIIPVQFWVYSKLTRKFSFQVFQILKNHLFLVIRYEHSARLTARHFKFGDFKNRLKKLEKLKIEDSHVFYTNYRTKDTDNIYELTTNNCQRNINNCENLPHQQKSHKNENSEILLFSNSMAINPVQHCSESHNFTENKSYRM